MCPQPTYDTYESRLRANIQELMHFMCIKIFNEIKFSELNLNISISFKLLCFEMTMFIKLAFCPLTDNLKYFRSFHFQSLRKTV